MAFLFVLLSTRISISIVTSATLHM